VPGCLAGRDPGQVLYQYWIAALGHCCTTASCILLVALAHGAPQRLQWRSHGCSMVAGPWRVASSGHSSWRVWLLSPCCCCTQQACNVTLPVFTRLQLSHHLHPAGSGAGGVPCSALLMTACQAACLLYSPCVQECASGEAAAAAGVLTATASQAQHQLTSKRAPDCMHGARALSRNPRGASCACAWARAAAACG